ncbi:ATP-dependent helicase [Helicobacter pametensis]|uniref:ATP-dependent helicase n=1 Tax=Helicobacter pametensis TaxID=95149 RepID=UPI00048180D8|nr:ATP-dependent helicase [Helicobacter pametensis]
MPLSKLNPEQLEAAKAPMGHNLIIASAGTGKTSTIVGRIAFLLQNGIGAEEILLLTFTNKASHEMIERVGRFFGYELAKKIQAGTFHAIAYKHLKEHQKVALKQPRELKVLFRSIYERRTFVDTFDSKPYTSQYLYDFYALYLNSSREREFGEYLEEKAPAQLKFLEIYEGIFDEFDMLKRDYGYVDYNDLLLLYRAEMQKLREKGDCPYKEILCDEYQDTNPLQESILQALNPSSLFCVGDYDQSIYAFNGADISIIGNFGVQYPQANVFTLTKNYRSSGMILDLANQVISRNERIYPKSLEVMKEGEFDAPKLLVYDELFLQYQGIAKRIASSGSIHQEIAIIFRNNSSADGIEASLRELGISSKRKGGSSFFETKEIALLLDLCSCFYNPKDMMAYIHVLSYGKGIGSSIAKDLYEALNALGEGDVIGGLLKPREGIKPYALRAKSSQMGLFEDFFALENASRFDAFLDPSLRSHPMFEHPKLVSEGAKFLNLFFLLIKQARFLSHPMHLIKEIRSSLFFREIIATFAKERAKNKDGSLDAVRETEAMERIERKVALLESLSKPYANLGAFLNAMILGGSEASDGSGVNLLSIHASKGLEFKEVYVVDLMDGRFPNRKLMSKGGSLEEERRLFYVAVTRAKEKLFLSYARKDELKKISYEPSIFLYEAGLILKDKE